MSGVILAPEDYRREEGREPATWPGYVREQMAGGAVPSVTLWAAVSREERLEGITASVSTPEGPEVPHA